MFFTILFLVLTVLILSHSDVSLYYAFHGFSLWYSKMIPTLVPFMIISGILIRLNLSEKFAGILHPVLGRIYKCNSNVSYAMIIGFLCGFPMGAKVTADLLHDGKISDREAQFLIAFNNNIGPVYFCGFALPVLGITNIFPAIIGMYGIPLLYAYILRKTCFKDIEDVIPSLATSFGKNRGKNTNVTINIFDAIDSSVQNAVQSILMLCGYMILFNSINILPHFLIPTVHAYIAPLLEITGGLGMAENIHPILGLCLLQFGGLSCIAQTNCMLRNTQLSLKQYIIHKLILSLLVAGYSFVFIYLFGISFS